MYQKHFHGQVEEFGRVAVLYGGVSAEREISLQSGEAILKSLLASGADAFGIDVNANALDQLTELKCDRVFIALHGVGGEDGKIQALLEWLNLPYTGSGVASSSLALNKLRTKLVWQGMGLNTPSYVVLSKDTDFAETLEKLGGECFVKPISEGSSIGMRCVGDVAALKEAYEFAAQFDSEVIAETKINGREFTVTVLNGIALPSIELSAKNEFYDFDAKYVSDQTEYLCPSPLDENKENEIREIATKAFEALGGKGWGRIDFMQDDKEKFYLLEANTVPGMTGHSLVPMSASAAGLSFEDLLKEILVGTL